MQPSRAFFPTCLFNEKGSIKLAPNPNYYGFLSHLGLLIVISIMLQQEIEYLKEWALALRGCLNRTPYYFNLESGELRERLARLTSSTATYMRIKFDQGLTAPLFTDVIDTDSDIDA